MRTLCGLALREFERTAREVGARREIPENLQRLVDWVKEHLDQPIGLDELAEKSGASRSTVQRLIRKHFNESALEWITGLKLSRAKWLLMSTTLLVSDVAQQVGFSDPYYFSRLFRAKEGQSPRACRSSGQFAAKRPK
jgi:transcriptional regulator GlxA family with amidase domain